MTNCEMAMQFLAQLRETYANCDPDQEYYLRMTHLSDLVSLHLRAAKYDLAVSGDGD